MVVTIKGTQTASVTQAIKLLILQIFRMAYCDSFDPKDKHVESMGPTFVQLAKTHMPELLQKPKLHLFLHLYDNMKDFGPPSSFNTERCHLAILLRRLNYCSCYSLRCEAFNKVMKSYNIHTNRHASSRDIAIRFAKVEHLQYICSTGRSVANLWLQAALAAT